MKDNCKLVLNFLFFILLTSVNLKANNEVIFNQKDLSNLNTIHDLIRVDNFNMIKSLTNLKEDINNKDIYGYSPLHLAVRLSKYDIAEYLIQHGAKINTIDTYGDTPLIDSTRNNDIKISKLLICNGADRIVADSNGMTPLENSILNKEITTLLLVKNLRPYCQKDIAIDINSINFGKNNTYSDKICGNITSGFVTNIDIEFKNQSDEVFGPFSADINNENKKWCINKEQLSLKNGHYKIIATATDKAPNFYKTTIKNYIHAPQLNFIFENQNITHNPSPQICGTSNSNFMNKLEVVLENKDKNLYGNFKGILDTKEKKWCVNITDKLPHGYYTIKAIAVDLYGQKININKKNYLVNTKQFMPTVPTNKKNQEKIKINITNLKEDFSHKPKICGKILEGQITKGQLTITDQNKYIKDISKLKIDNKNKSWCTQITKSLNNGIYNINLEVIDKQFIQTSIIEKIKIYTIPKLYEALIREFQKDLIKWNAHIDKNNLTFSFKDKLLFEKNGEINKKYKKILIDFFPRYIKVTSLFQKDIHSITIEGNSQSKNILSFLNQIIDKNIANNILWILKTFKFNTSSSSKLVYNKNDRNNQNLFKKIEFKIKNNNYNLSKSKENK